jgi:hypothetical protein
MTAKAHLDHPGDLHWFSGYGPLAVLGECPHAACRHTGTSVIAWGPDLARYELVQCDLDCDSSCRAWVDGRGVATTPWLRVDGGHL